jgi:DNA-binding response OmpR family regulator
MDITMPDMDGWDTVQCIVEEELYEGCIISMLTGLHVPGPKLDGLKEYVIDYITKPFDPTELADTVVKYLAYL